MSKGIDERLADAHDFFRCRCGMHTLRFDVEEAEMRMRSRRPLSRADFVAGLPKQALDPGMDGKP